MHNTSYYYVRLTFKTMLYYSLRRSEKNGVTHENSGNTMQNTQFANKWLTKDVKKKIMF
jgi:hypothetical protein